MTAQQNSPSWGEKFRQVLRAIFLTESTPAPEASSAHSPAPPVANAAIVSPPSEAATSRSKPHADTVLSRWVGQRHRIPWAVPLLLIPVLWLTITTPLSLENQALLAILLWVSALLVSRMPGRFPNILLASLAVLASVRYLWWRVSHTLDLSTGVEQVLAVILLGAEIYAWTILCLGFFQMLWPNPRKVTPLPEDRSTWPSVDVFIPTYDEPASVVKPTLYAACGLDWPADKLRIYLLDDGDRPEYRQLAEKLGVEYLARRNGKHAKAGNLNNGLIHSDGEFVMVMDCDHVPVSNFLVTCMGKLIADARCALVQTPHHFFSADPIERNLGVVKTVPNESRLFYGIIQPGNDFWNAAFFCGSCAVLRRKALDDVGGFAVETVTEDVHTSLKIHRAGYSSAYLAIPLAAGLATENLSAHLHQRMRWARGMSQVLVKENPLFGHGLNLYQRVCYFSSMLHFFNGIPRLIFLTAPLAYLWFGYNLFAATAVMIIAYALPYLAISNLATSKIQGEHRHSFWSEIYETLLAWHTTTAAIGALLKPHNRRFNVTDKGLLIDSTHFEWQLAVPYLTLISLNVSGIAFGLMDLFRWGFLDPYATVLNLFWVTFNLVVLGASGGVAEELAQQRRSHRVDAKIPITLRNPDGSMLSTHTENFSAGGLRVQWAAEHPQDHATVEVSFVSDQPTQWLAAQIISVDQNAAQLRFLPLNVEQEKYLTQSTFGRADLWLNWADDKTDRPMTSLMEVFTVGIRGYRHIFKSVWGVLRGRKTVVRQAATQN